jgi:hypothetical protein
VSTQIQTIYNPQDVGNRRIVRGNPNFNLPGGRPTYGEPGWTCQDWLSGLLFSYYGVPGYKGWATSAPVALFPGVLNDLSSVHANLVSMPIYDEQSFSNVEGFGGGPCEEMRQLAVDITSPGNRFIRLNQAPFVEAIFFAVADNFDFTYSNLTTNGLVSMDIFANRFLFDGGVMFPRSTPGLRFISLRSTLSSVVTFDIDIFFNELVDATVQNNGFVILDNMGSPTAASAASRAALIARGWTLSIS